LAADGYELQQASTVATRRQTVDVLIATPTAWQRVATSCKLQHFVRTSEKTVFLQE
jgi:hypothetical protein